MSEESKNAARPLLSPVPLLRCCNKGTPPHCGFCAYCLEWARREPEIHAGIKKLLHQLAVVEMRKPDHVEMPLECDIAVAFRAGWRQWKGSVAPALPTPQAGQPGRPSPLSPHQDVETATDETVYVTPGRPSVATWKTNGDLSGYWGPGFVDQLGSSPNANGQQWIQLTPEQRAANDRAMAAQQAQSPAASAALDTKKGGQG